MIEPEHYNDGKPCETCPHWNNGEGDKSFCPHCAEHKEDKRYLLRYPPHQRHIKYVPNPEGYQSITVEEPKEETMPTWNRIFHLLRHLNKTPATIFLQKFILGMSYREISKFWHIKRSTIHRHVQKVLGYIKENF